VTVLTQDGFFAPVHDWTIQIGDGVYGFIQFGRSESCVFFAGHHIATFPFSAPATVTLLLIIAAILAFAAFYLLGRAKDKGEAVS
jgi:hypothetical protein